MSEERSSRELTRVICPVCGTVNASTVNFCQSCWSRLETGQVVSEAESRRYEAAVQRRARRARWRRRALLASLGAFALIFAAVIVLFAYLLPPPSLPPASTRLTSASAAGEWAMAGYDLGHTRFVPHPYALRQGRLKWKVSVNAPFLTTPVAVADSVYVAGGDGRVIALDTATGEHRWQVRVGSPVDSSPAVAGDRLYLALRDRSLLALDRTSGTALWAVQAGGPLVAPPLVVEGRVYAVSAVAGEVIGVDAATGEIVWQGSLKGSWLTSAVSWAGHTMVVAAGNEVFYFDTRTGRHVFSYRSPIGSIVGAPVVAGGTVYAAISPGNILALDVKARTPFWEPHLLPIWRQLAVWGVAPQPPRPSGLLGGYVTRGRLLAPPAVTDSAFYFGTTGGRIVAVDRQSRQVLWSYQGKGEVRGAPAVVNETIYVGAGDHLYALNARSGEVLWSFQTAAPIATDIVVTAEAVYVGDVASTLYAIE